MMTMYIIAIVLQISIFIYIRVSYMLFDKENKTPIFTISIMKSIRVVVTASEIILIGIFIVSSFGIATYIVCTSIYDYNGNSNLVYCVISYLMSSIGILVLEIVTKRVIIKVYDAFICIKILGKKEKKIRKEKIYIATKSIRKITLYNQNKRICTLTTRYTNFDELLFFLNKQERG